MEYNKTIIDEVEEIVSKIKNSEVIDFFDNPSVRLCNQKEVLESMNLSFGMTDESWKEWAKKYKKTNRTGKNR